MTDAGADGAAPWVRLARRRRLGRRALLVGTPAVALVVTVVVVGSPSLPGLLALGTLVTLVLSGWWWLERSAGQVPWWRRWRSTRGDSSSADDGSWHQELDAARAEYALRHHVTSARDGSGGSGTGRSGTPGTAGRRRSSRSAGPPSASRGWCGRTTAPTRSSA